ncbi:MaoC family dehydratase [Comamonas sp. lk]|uniref:MaoC family dehydratase n=1 Tax=Comamonas sp. lk TaxID=2201272 RepID=UPI000EAE2A42|nr:MaoC family dehydratase [Comamonas sp. lk]
MPQLEISSLSALSEWIDQPVPPSDWLAITQERINQFAQASGDHQWIHVDTERVSASPFGATVAHGFLTLALLSRFLNDTVQIHGVRMGVNCGVNRVRFTAPVKAGARLRAHFKLVSLEPIDGGVQLTWSASIEQEGQEKPCCVAEWVQRRFGAS